MIPDRHRTTGRIIVKDVIGRRPVHPSHLRYLKYRVSRQMAMLHGFRNRCLKCIFLSILLLVSERQRVKSGVYFFCRQSRQALIGLGTNTVTLRIITTSEAAWSSGQSAGLETRRSRVRVSNPSFKSEATLCK